jgi:hypothetical protein
MPAAPDVVAADSRQEVARGRWIRASLPHASSATKARFPNGAVVARTTVYFTTLVAIVAILATVLPAVFGLP